MEDFYSDYDGKTILVTGGWGHWRESLQEVLRAKRQEGNNIRRPLFLL